MKSSTTIKLSLLALLAISLSACNGGKCEGCTDRDVDLITVCSESDTDLPYGCLSALGNIELKLVENGTFAMGTNSNDTATYASVDWANPKHNVTISKPYYLGIYEVTQWQYFTVTDSNPSTNEGWNIWDIIYGDIRHHPVETITYRNVRDFIQALNAAEPNITINGEQYLYSLPSEAEWEYAARANTTSERFFCEDNSSDCATLMDDYGWYSGNSGGRHHKVGTKLPNDWGFYDMYGNVDEWLYDIGHPGVDCKYSPENITNPVCGIGGDSGIVRVGSYLADNTTFFSAGSRAYARSPGKGMGFRVALVAKSVRDNMTKYLQGAIVQ